MGLQRRAARHRLGRSPAAGPRAPHGAGIEPVYKLVDTCAAEFEAATPYYYSTYETPYHARSRHGDRLRLDRVEDEIRLTDKPKVIIIGGGPNRIGQGIEFDYCCVQAAFAMQELGLESVMINSNPETVSTDYDTSDLLFFEPLTHEDILNICERLNGEPVRAKPRDRHPRPRQGRHRPVRRPDAAEPRPRPQGSRRAHPRHHRRVASTPPATATVPRPAPAARPQAARERHRPQRRRGPRDRQADRLPRPRPPQLRARRPGDGNRLRRGPAQLLHDPRRRGVDDRRCADPVDKFLDDATEVRRRLHRGLRPRRQPAADAHAAPTRQADRHRRHGAHRGSRHPLRRLAPARCRPTRCRKEIVERAQASRPRRSPRPCASAA